MYLQNKVLKALSIHKTFRKIGFAVMDSETQLGTFY